jgi:hypothetical protein
MKRLSHLHIVPNGRSNYEHLNTLREEVNKLVSPHSNRKKHYQLVEPHYQGLGSGFGSCLAVKHERNGNNHFGTATTNMVVNYQIPNQLLTTTVW